MLTGFGWSLRELNVDVMYRPPVDIYIDQWVYDLMDAVERTKARRFSRQGVSVLMTLETPRLYGSERISDTGVFPFADNVVLLGYQQERDMISRTICVIKTRASGHDPAVRTFVIGREGIVLDDAVTGDSRAAGQARIPTS